jgi:hypothetical protein
VAHSIPIDLIFERSGDGRYRVTSDDVPGLYMAGSDIDAIQGDLDEVVSDLLRHNCGFIVSEIRWMPSLNDVKQNLQKPHPEGRVRYIASGQLTA